MRYWTATTLGIGLFVLCVAVFCIELTALLDIGSCASGNQPFVIERECPEGTTGSGLLLAASIVGLCVAAGFVAARGKRPSSTIHGSFLVLHGWALFFTVSGTVALLHALTSDVIGADGKTGGIIVGITFLLMGLPALAFVVIDMIGDLRRGNERPSFPVTPSGAAERAVSRFVPRPPATVVRSPAGSPWGADSTASGSDEMLDALERLQRLRDQGALTEAEFGAQKRRILES